MQYKFFQSIVLLLFSILSYGQSLNKKELGKLQGIIFDYLIGHDKNTNPERQSEYILCILKLDNQGKISQINLLADDKNKDTTYSILSRMTPDIFNKWQSEKCKGKSIFIPILSTAPKDGPVYTKIIREAYAVKPYIIAPLTIVEEKNNLIILSTFQHAVPSSVN